ncbi:hypothetical protein WG68_00180 [Arsukibacterium ikkense]|uniref:Ice-binding protein C-terminal domain-containing protein n=1 Tax=Arsukibacterium ikkense TaxID=336831 RepID=A0A0M2VDD0_9GAMM|nr:PEP-CTERM sorting domain-containing protein [Arsukibacterium ikkense]KKO47113.1 hypothetical protein WG68_00180 [Arsukibacterium ikkense]
MKLKTRIIKVYHKVAFASLVIAGGLFSAGASAGLIYTPWTESSVVTFSNPPPASTEYIASGPEYVWYCEPPLESCAGDATGPNMVHFRKTFTLPPQDFNGIQQYVWGNITIMADDYFALFINGVFKGENWLDVNNAATYFDIQQDLILGQVNQIDIFACDGAPTAGLNAGATLAGGLNACRNSYPRVNHWLLIDGSYTVEDNVLGGTVNANGSFRSTDLWWISEWEVRAASIPEPGSLFLLGLGLCAFSARYQRRSKQ